MTVQKLLGNKTYDQIYRGDRKIQILIKKHQDAYAVYYSKKETRFWSNQISMIEEIINSICCYNLIRIEYDVKEEI